MNIPAIYPVTFSLAFQPNENDVINYMTTKAAREDGNVVYFRSSSTCFCDHPATAGNEYLSTMANLTTTENKRKIKECKTKTSKCLRKEKNKTKKQRQKQKRKKKDLE